MTDKTITKLKDLISIVREYDVIVLEGPNGVGKSHISQELREAFPEAQYYTTWPTRRVDRSYSTELKADISQCSLWILDFLAQARPEKLIYDRSVPTTLLSIPPKKDSSGIANSYVSTDDDETKEKRAKYYNQKMRECNGITILLEPGEGLELPVDENVLEAYRYAFDRFSVDHIRYLNGRN